MSNQNYRQERSRNEDRGQGSWDDPRDQQGSRGQYQDRDDYRSREQEGRGGPQDWDRGNYDQGNYRQDDYGQDNYGQQNFGQNQRGGRHQGGRSGNRGGQSDRNYGFERDEYGSGYAQGGQGGYQRGNFQGGGGYDRGQGQYGPNQGGGYQQAGNQGGSSWGQNGGMQRGNESGGQSHRGRGPKNYQRSDDRISEDVCDRLSDDHDVDASNIDVSVSDREVTLSGEVDSKQAKRYAEDCADGCSGVEHVQNNLRVKKSQSGQEDDSSNTQKPK